jgi:hypothetical protein
MPVKRRTAKRRVDPETEMMIWSSVFGSGRDFFGELPSLGVSAGPGGVVDREAAREAWHRLGAAYMDDPINGCDPWALREFGEPPCR